jgi:hypothetical protein
MDEFTPVRAFDVRVSQHRDSLILVRGQDVFELHEVEGLIWSLCDGTHPINEIVAEVVTRYDVDRATAAQDVDEFLQEMQNEKLVEPA